MNRYALKFMSGDLMDRTRSHSPEVTVCGLSARTCAQLVADYAWVIYTISIMAMAEGRVVYSVRCEMMKLVSAFDRYYFRQNDIVNAELYKDSFTCSSDISALCLRCQWQLLPRSTHKGRLNRFQSKRGDTCTNRKLHLDTCAKSLSVDIHRT